MENNKLYKTLNVFTFELKTEEMMIRSNNGKSISLKEILIATKNCDVKDFIKFEKIGVTLEITFINQNVISFKIFEKQAYQILRNPIKIIFLGKEMEIVCSQQLEYFLKKNFINPRIYCNCQAIVNVSILNIIRHKPHPHIFNIREYEEIKCLDIYNVGLILNKYEQKFFLRTVFTSPMDFEKNFNYYFKFSDNRKELYGLFNIFDDEYQTRFYISYEFCDLNNFGQKLNYFGGSGKGKSITLIGSLKYSIDHKLVGTLYINCKALKNLLENQNFTLVRKILLDEILFLFYGNYDKYQLCFQLINSFNFLSATSFWEIIDLILKECSNLDKKFIIGFDQYNNSVDKENYLNRLETTYLNKKDKFKFIVISSMNELDVRQIKINLLFENRQNENISELEEVCKDFKTNLNQKELEIFNKLGKTFKAYNELQLIEGKDELDSYIKEKKKKYLLKLVSFYKGENNKEKYNLNMSEEEILNSFDNIYDKFLSFKTDYIYSKLEIMKVIKNIPFKLFNVTEIDGVYKVKPGFPLISEILDDIYRYIVVTKSFNAFKYLANNKGSAFSSLFEYKVRYNFYPQIKGDIDYFKEFIIQENVNMEVIIPKERDKDEPKFIKKLEPNKTYLVEQKQFGGKNLDFLIIHMSEKPKVFAFQVSTYKKEIFTSLSKTFGIMLKRLYISFQVNIEEENVYFGYIFDYSRLETPEYRVMLEKCNNNNMKFSFYDIIMLYLIKIKKNYVVYMI